MTRFTRLTMLSAMAAGLVACGGGAKLGGGKEGAAQAAFRASQPAARGGQTSQQLLEKALASGATNVSFSASCANGGKANLTLDATNIGQNGEFNYSVSYDNCNEDGKNEYNGTMAMSFKVTSDISNGTISASIITGMKGKLTIEGDVSDFIDANVKLTMDVSATATRSGSVKLVLDGTVKTTEGNYVYANETLNITAGELPEA
jgi:hypothetical protein